MQTDTGGLLLALMYSLLYLVMVYQAMLIFTYRHKLVSVQNGIVLLCLLWIPLRIIFWVKTTIPSSWPTTVVIFLYDLPAALWFNTFSLLTVFTAQVIHWRRWRDVRGAYMFGLGFLNAATWAATVVVSSLSQAHLSIKTFQTIRLVTLGVIYLSMSMLLGWHGIKFQTLGRHEYMHTQLPRSPLVFSLCNTLLCLIFFARSIYEFCSLNQGLLPPRLKLIQFNREHPPLDWGIFWITVTFQIVPTVILVLIVWKVNPRRNSLLCESFFATRSPRRGCVLCFCATH